MWMLLELSCSRCLDSLSGYGHPSILLWNEVMCIDCDLLQLVGIFITIFVKDFTIKGNANFFQMSNE